MSSKKTLVSHLGRSYYEKIPEDVSKKIEKILNDGEEKQRKLKNQYNDSQKTNSKLIKDLQAMMVENSRLKSANSNVSELRDQLNKAFTETNGLTEQITKLELENIECRKERDAVIDERDQLMTRSNGMDITISRLQSDLRSSDEKLLTTISEKNIAVANALQMIENKESTKKKMEKQIESLNSEIATITGCLKEVESELMVARQKIVPIEADLIEKTEKLRIAECTIRQLSESNEKLTSQCDVEVARLKDQLNEAVTLMEHYKRELDSNIKLADLHKANFDDLQAETVKQSSDDIKLRKNLKETLEKCEELESKLNAVENKYQMSLKEKDETIAKLREEFAGTEHAEKVLEKMFPKAAASNRMLKGNLSLTDIYSRYHNALGDVHRLEVECLHLNTKLECLTIKHQDTTSEFERQHTEFRNILRVNEEMTQQMNVIVADQDSLREKLNVTSMELANVEKENIQLKYTQKDLARQICNLLNKVETNGNELTSDQQQFKRMRLSNEAIRKELITFDNIVELQENNQKLIMKVRELSSKVEKLEEQNIGSKCYEEKISNLERRLCDGERARQANEDLLAMTLKQKEILKQWYNDAIKSSENATMEVELREKTRDFKILQEAYNECREQAEINFNLLKKEYEIMEHKVSELQSMNSQLQSQSNFTDDLIKSYKNDIAIYKKQIQILEDRNRMYDKTVAKHETANKQLREEALNTILQLSTAENRCDYLELECRRLLEAQKSVDIENKVLQRQKMTERILESSLELQKISSERSQFEGRLKLEKKLDDQVQKCKTLTRQLEDRGNRFREENESLKREKESSCKKLIDEQAQTEILRAKLAEVREQVQGKNLQIKSLSEKLQAAKMTSNSDSLSKKNKSFKELEVDVKRKTAEIDQLKLELEECTTKAASIYKLNSDLEAEMNALKGDLETCRLSESNLKSHIKELQQEIRFQLNNQSNVATEKKIRDEALEKCVRNNEELLELRKQYHELKENLRIVEEKYTDAKTNHSLDLQMLTLRKAELNKCQEQMQQLKMEKDAADEMLLSSQLKLEATSKKLIEDRQELELKVESLEKQTMELVDLLHTQNNKLLPLSDETLNESVANSSTIHDGELSTEKLFGLVKYLRREKDIAVTQTDSLKIEKTRFLAELDMQNKRINELNVQLNSIKLHKSSVIEALDVVSAAKYEDLRLKVETLNAVTDSNIHLRAEKDDLDNKVKHLTEQVTRLEAELDCRSIENREISEISEEKKQENEMLRSNIVQLNKRVDELTERNKTIPEELTEMQKERENLTKMLTSEMDNLRQVTEQLDSMKTEKARLDQELATKTKQLHATLGDLKQLNKRSVQVATATIDDKEIQLLESTFSPKEAQLNESESSCELKASSTENARPALVSLTSRTLKRPRENGGDSNNSSAAEKASPLIKRVCLQTKSSSSSQRVNDVELQANVDEGFDAANGAIKLNERAQNKVDPKVSETGDDESTASVVDDVISEVGSVDSGRVSSISSELTEKGQGGTRLAFRRLQFRLGFGDSGSQQDPGQSRKYNLNTDTQVPARRGRNTAKK